MNLTDDERRLLRHMREMGGWVSAPLVAYEHEVMGDLMSKDLAELIGDGAQRRYQLTDAGRVEADSD